MKIEGSITIDLDPECTEEQVKKLKGFIENSLDDYFTACLESAGIPDEELHPALLDGLSADGKEVL